MKLNISWIGILILGLALFILIVQGKKVYEAFNDVEVEEGFANALTNDIILTTCPAKTKSFVDNLGNTVCCDGDVENGKCKGKLVCSITDSKSGMPTCGLWYASYLEQKGKDICAPSMPNYFENPKTGARGCAAGKRKKDGSAPLNSTIKFCKLYKTEKEERLKMDSCKNQKLLDETKCFKGNYTNVTKKLVPGFIKDFSPLVECTVQNSSKKSLTMNPPTKCYGNNSLINLIDNYIKYINPNMTNIKSDINKSWDSRSKMMFCSVAEKVDLEKTVPFEDAKFIDIFTGKNTKPVSAPAKLPLKVLKVSGESSIAGGKGGLSRNMTCNSGSYVKEIFGTSDKVINSIGIKCSDGITQGPFGGKTGKSFSVKSNSGFGGLKVNASQYVNNLTFINTVGKELSKIGGANAGGKSSAQTCPGGKMMGLKVKTGNFVDSIQTVCGQEM
jgi:hypothetical protein